MGGSGTLPGTSCSARQAVRQHAVVGRANSAPPFSSFLSQQFSLPDMIIRKIK